MTSYSVPGPARRFALPAPRYAFLSSISSTANAGVGDADGSGDGVGVGVGEGVGESEGDGADVGLAAATKGVTGSVGCGVTSTTRGIARAPARASSSSFV